MPLKKTQDFSDLKSLIKTLHDMISVWLRFDLVWFRHLNDLVMVRQTLRFGLVLSLDIYHFGYSHDHDHG